MQALNKKEVISKSLHFWVQFGILVFSILFVIYFFIWSSVQENRKYTARLQEYKRIENTQILLDYQVDSLYWYVDKLAPDQISDERFLERSIRDRRQAILDICYKDSTANFDGYKKIAEKLNAQTALRDTIFIVEQQTGSLKNALDLCKSRTTYMRNSLNAR